MNECQSELNNKLRQFQPSCRKWQTQRWRV